MRWVITRTSCRSVLKPVHNQIQSSLQSVCDMWTHLCRYPVAGVAFAAPGTCKQHTPQITPICDGVHYTTLLYLNTHAACSGAPRGYMEHDHAAHCAQNCCPASVPCSSKLNHCVQQTVRGRLTWQCYSARSNNPEGTSVVQSTSEAGNVSADPRRSTK